MTAGRTISRSYGDDGVRYRLVGAIALVVVAAVFTSLVQVYRGGFATMSHVTVLTSRSGLSVETGTKVTLNGVAIGRVRSVRAEEFNGQPSAQLRLEVDPRFLDLIPVDAAGHIVASTVFGGKKVAFSTGSSTAGDHLHDGDQIDSQSVTVEFNTLFETVVDVAQHVDPIKLNETLTATAQALDGLGDRFGQSIEHGNEILGDVNPQMPRIREDNQRLAGLADVYSNAAPDIIDGLDSAVVTARALNKQQTNIDQALMASIGFGNTGADITERSAPYLIRGSADLVPTSHLFDEYSPALFCTIRNYHDLQPEIAEVFGGNGYSARTHSLLVGVGNPYVYPDNLPRVNAHGGPEGRPGCWAPPTRDLWPAPYLVMDTGASIAPYNHVELGQPLTIEYVWGRQIGENTINP